MGFFFNLDTDRTETEARKLQSRIHRIKLSTQLPAASKYDLLVN